ncbi:GNAT family N-acetyltransferase [Paenibacillus amylolyticus]|nr:GNAT family N-acetyltransferase [Paenibacillus amylolyticus]WFR61682.1 GNAT family N-acetyltransferase [Paenibacillus amylolyticus]
MITYRTLTLDDVNQLQAIDRSEHIDLIYEMRENRLVELEQDHECSNWDEKLLQEIQNRYVYELEQGGMAYGAFADDLLIGFGVLAHQLRGREQNQLQVDLMYVTRGYRRQGIGKRILNQLGEEAKKRGAQICISPPQRRDRQYPFTEARAARLLVRLIKNSTTKSRKIYT